MHRILRAAIAALIMLSLVLPASTIAQSPVPVITPPGQPETGPGSAENYRYPGARVAYYGAPGSGYWLVEPTSDAAGATPAATDPLPVILHFNGCCGDDGYTTPDELTGWYTHLARQGYVIVAPVYADYSPDSILDTSVMHFEEALDELGNPGHAAVDLDKMAVTAYSYGSPAAMQYTAAAEANGWPVPKALFVMAPCVGRFCYDVPEITSLPDGLKAVVMSFDVDDVPGVEWPQRYFDQLTILPESDRAFVELRSDDHGWPALLATHYTGVDQPESIDSVAAYYATQPQPDALDTWGIWKVSSGLFDCAFTGENCEYALGNGDELTNMGAWSDGVPVRPLTVSTDPITDWAMPAAPVSPDAETFLTVAEDGGTIKGIGLPQHVAEGPDGLLYAINGAVNLIEIREPTGEPVGTFGTRGDGPGEFLFGHPNIPIAFGDLAFASDGSLYVADTYNDRVQIFDPELNFVAEVGTDPSDRGMLIAPTGIALDEANNRFFVTSYTEGAVKVYDLDGNFIERWGADGPNGVYFDQPNDVLVAPDGTVYVSETGRSRVHHFAADGAPIGVIGGNGLEPGHLAEPHGIALDADGNLYVAEYNTLGYGGTRLQVFSPEGEVIGLISKIDNATLFIAPAAVMVASDGTVYLSDEQNRTIYRFNRATP